VSERARNLELVRSIMAAWAEGNFGSTEWAHPDIEYVIADGPAPGTWRGVAGMADGSRHFLDPWEGYRAVADQYLELDDERVLVLLRDASGRGKVSGVDLGAVQGKKANLFELRDGKVTRYVVWFDRERAFADLGLTPNVELVRSIYAAWGHGDFNSTGWADPEIEYVNPEGAVEPGTRRGIDEFARAVQSVFDGWSTWRMEPERFESAGDQVAVVLRYTARGRSSGVTVEGRESALWTVHDGRVVRYAWFDDPEAALKALGR
jgi:ketosteroid isomerase-like protein